MCGICGLVHHDRNQHVDEQALSAMCEAIAHRGPDDSGRYVGEGVGLGSRRLAILDLSPRGRMPMRTEDGRFHIVYNGEVYNAAELRHDLEARGRTFQSRTDTEVVLRLYEAEGPAMLNRLNGMFAVAIWDARDRVLFLARDRLGVKPLYYAGQNDALWFGSEAKALFAGGLRPEFDPAVWEELLCFRYVSGEVTPYQGVRRLLPGHYLLWREGVITIRRWWSLAERVEELRNGTADDDLVEWYRETFDDAVALRRISDVPVGVLLSGGLDSGTVAASLAAQFGRGVHSFTVSFDAAGYDEAPLARQVARRWGLEYHDIRVQARDLLPRLLRASWLNDEPLAHGNELHLWAVAELARPVVTVLLSGEGADETLGGYVRYSPLRFPRLLNVGRAVVPARLLAGVGRGRLRKMARMLRLGSQEAMVLFNACEVLPPELEALDMDPDATGHGFGHRESALREAVSMHPNDPLRQAMYLDHHTFLVSLLDRNDRMTMGASIECRVPFLDHRLVERLAASPTPRLMPDCRSKSLLRDGLGQRLPHDVLRGRKWGFGVPWDQYLRSVPELREITATLPDRAPVREGPFARAAVARVARAFLSGDARASAIVRQLVLISLWHEACVASWPATSAPTLRAVAR